MVLVAVKFQRIITHAWHVLHESFRRPRQTHHMHCPNKMRQSASDAGLHEFSFTLVFDVRSTCRRYKSVVERQETHTFRCRKRSLKRKKKEERKKKKEERKKKNSDAIDGVRK